MPQMRTLKKGRSKATDSGSGQVKTSSISNSNATLSRHIGNRATSSAKEMFTNHAQEREADRVASNISRTPQDSSATTGADSVAQNKSSIANLTSVNSIDDSAGKKLPQGERAFFEKQIGADFSNVRIHTDQKANNFSEALSARAFTHGRDIYFNRGEFNLNSEQGRHTVAHELTHVKQQAVANRADIQRLAKVTSGEFGLALDWFFRMHMQEPTAIRLVSALRSSPTFMRMARSLDRRVIFPEKDGIYYHADANGLVFDESNRPLNKRSIFVYPSWNGTFFAPHGTPVPGNTGDWDTLYIQHPGHSEPEEERVERYASQIAHEARHAWHANTSRARAARTEQASIRAGIREESDVRSTEATIMNEIRRAGGHVPAAVAPTTPAAIVQQIESGSAVADVERSFVSRAPTKTYLESSLFGFAKRQYVGTSTTGQLSKIMRAVNAMTLDVSVLNESYTLTDYGQALGLFSTTIPDIRRNVDWATYYLLERLFGMEWESFQGQGLSVQDYFDQKEIILQKHLRILQRVGQVSYSTRIAHP